MNYVTMFPIHERQKCFLAPEAKYKLNPNFMLRLGICLFSWSFPPVPHKGAVLWARRNLSVFLLQMTSSEGILQSTPVLLFTGYRNVFRSHEVCGNFTYWAWLSPVSVQYFNHMTCLAIVSHRNLQMQKSGKNIFLLTACHQRTTY